MACCPEEYITGSDLRNFTTMLAPIYIVSVSTGPNGAKLKMMLPSGLLCLLMCFVISATSCAQRRRVVRTFNVRRNTSSSTTPLQVGNGNFAFGVDVTGLQTFNPFGTLSTWGWHNFSLPTTLGQASVNGQYWSPGPDIFAVDKSQLTYLARLHRPGLVDSRKAC